MFEVYSPDADPPVALLHAAAITQRITTQQPQLDVQAALVEHGTLLLAQFPYLANASASTRAAFLESDPAADVALIDAVSKVVVADDLTAADDLEAPAEAADLAADDLGAPAGAAADLAAADDLEIPAAKRPRTRGRKTALTLDAQQRSDLLASALDLASCPAEGFVGKDGTTSGAGGSGASQPWGCRFRLAQPTRELRAEERAERTRLWRAGASALRDESVQDGRRVPQAVEAFLTELYGSSLTDGLPEHLRHVKLSALMIMHFMRMRFAPAGAEIDREIEIYMVDDDGASMSMW